MRDGFSTDTQGGSCFMKMMLGLLSTPASQTPMLDTQKASTILWVARHGRSLMMYAQVRGNAWKPYPQCSPNPRIWNNCCGSDVDSMFRGPVHLR